jgi:vacuolar-type H+-ATPase subunit H
VKNLSSNDLLHDIRATEEEAQKKIETAKIEGEEKLKLARKQAQEKIEKAKKEATEYQKKLADDLLTSTKEETTKIELENQKQLAELKGKTGSKKQQAIETFVKLVSTVE